MACYLECFLQAVLLGFIILHDLRDDEGLSAHERKGACLETRPVVRSRIPCVGSYCDTRSRGRIP